MPQPIEVKFVNPSTSEVIHQAFTAAASHKEVIDLAMRDFSAGTGVIKRIDPVSEPEHPMKAGTSFAWRYIYRCVVADDEYDRDMIAVLFAQYGNIG